MAIVTAAAPELIDYVPVYLEPLIISRKIYTAFSALAMLELIYLRRSPSEIRIIGR